MNQTVRFVKACGKIDISVIFGALHSRTATQAQQALHVPCIVVHVQREGFRA